MQPALSVEALYALTRADAQIAAASFSNENYAVFSKKFSMVCDAKVKAESAESSLEVSNETVLEEMANRPGMVGRLVIPSVGVNVALFSGSDQAIVDAQDNCVWPSCFKQTITSKPIYPILNDDELALSADDNAVSAAPVATEDAING